MPLPFFMVADSKQRGFTLIETLIYLAIFTIVIGGTVGAAYGLFASSGHGGSKAMLQEEVNFIMSKILWSLNNAQTITDPVSGGSGPSLTFSPYGVGPSVTVSTTSADIFLDGNKLNNSNVILDQVLFKHIYDAPTNVRAVEINVHARTFSPTGLTVFHLASTTRYIRK